MSGESKPVIGTDLESIMPEFLNRSNTLRARDLADILGYLSSRRSVERTLGQQPRACVFDGFDVKAQTVPNMTVQVDVGMAQAPASGTSGVVGSPQTLEDSNVVLLNKRTISAAVAVAAADPSVTRWDLIEARPTATPATVGVDETKIVKLWSDALNDYVDSSTARATMVHGEPDIVVTTGVPGSDHVPAPTAGRVPVAVVMVPGGATSITQGNVYDVRQFFSDLQQSQAEAPSSLDVEEFIVDPVSGTNPLISIRATGRVKGVPFALRTDAPLTYNSSLFLDANVSLAAYTGWVYAYVVVTDDKGHRYARSRVTNSVDSLVSAGGDLSHCGLLVFSTVAPSLVNGSLAPSASMKTPVIFGSSLIGTTIGRAVCIGAVYVSAGSFSGGLRMIRGKADLLNSGVAVTFAAGWTRIAEVSGSPAFSAAHADFGSSQQLNPLAALTWDVSAKLDLGEGGTYGAAATVRRILRVYEKDASGTTKRGLRALHEVQTRGSSTFGGAAAAELHVLDVSVAKNPAARATPDGIYVECQADYPSATTGNGVLGTTFVVTLLGYRWPQGAVQV